MWSITAEGNERAARAHQLDERGDYDGHSETTYGADSSCA